MMGARAEKVPCSPHTNFRKSAKTHLFFKVRLTMPRNFRPTRGRLSLLLGGSSCTHMNSFKTGCIGTRSAPTATAPSAPACFQVYEWARSVPSDGSSRGAARYRRSWPAGSHGKLIQVADRAHQERAGEPTDYLDRSQAVVRFQVRASATIVFYSSPRLCFKL
jgi:hypothetical protein